jgi:hypothetical protein
LLTTLFRAWFYRWWAVNRATFAEPYANWQSSHDFTLWGEAGQEMLDIHDRAGPFKTREEADAVCLRMNTAALEGFGVHACHASTPDPSNPRLVGTAQVAPSGQRQAA